MLKPLELSLFPSCIQAVAWSSDGELAVASGEHVQILTPKASDQADPEQEGKDAWDTIRIRVNVFTNLEWAIIYPQSRDDFSLGVEQSFSHVIGIAWSPPGLGRFRRSVLTVLTANLILSLWEPVGENGQWVRVAIVNHVMHPDPGTVRALRGEELRRFNIRSFHWCPPLLVPNSPVSSQSSSDPESRWGIHLLVAANDNNELAMFRVRRFPKSQSSPQPYCVEKLAFHPVKAEGALFPQSNPETILSRTLQERARILSVSCGPWDWSASPRDSSSSFASAMVAVTYGARLLVFKASVGLNDLHAEEKVTPRYEAIAKFADHTLGSMVKETECHRVTGPLEWLHMVEEDGRGNDQLQGTQEQGSSRNIILVVGIIGGVVTLSIPLSVYNESSKDTKAVKVQDWPAPIFPAKNKDAEPHLEPVSGFVSSKNARGTPVLQMGTLGGLRGCMSLNPSGELDAWTLPPWSRTVDNFREQYDLDLDLGGETTVRIWGVATCRGLSAVLFTRHPTDMIEYRMSSAERTMIAFGSEELHSLLDLYSRLRSGNGELPPASEQREGVITFLLSCGVCDNIQSHEDQKLVYAAACCAIVDNQKEAIRSQARRALEHLTTLTGADLSIEISKCNADPSHIPFKPSHLRDSPAAHLFEWCEVCGSSLSWSSPDEAQCAEGHVFARCSLSFLAIQEPGISKYCPVCQREFFDEDELASLPDSHFGPLFRKLFEAYDACIYCESKFQSS
ncbi:hypothetical protein N7468_009752 [Penicillium chermesinum]|uniref:Transcription factor IIIC 90kDa subunit N-terminal domain-containing protein n=1 Tax=Penicillium chermesinum TaxID=63820 RepID=A0A9W9TFA5_9EURO|nr:uncharacterized protein N7468_009752 [Penicillium chermesinum]KAJ5220548.1 hypothetical protein N7468_009752 [Penicillium chermesinum]KAJ6157974.1 hypothetical protein N7470_005566 [Penicillium chermesinum]